MAARESTHPLGGQARPARGLDRTAIAEATIEVGFVNLTVVGLAKHLGVTHAALYRHVTSREELITLAVDRLVRRVDWSGPSKGWLDFLQDQAWKLWGLADANPGLAQEMAVLESPPSSVKQRQWLAVDRLVELGFGGDDAVLAADLVYDLVFNVYIRTAVIEGSGSASASSDWFAKKLAVVLAGIAATLAPPD